MLRSMNHLLVALSLATSFVGVHSWLPGNLPISSLIPTTRWTDTRLLESTAESAGSSEPSAPDITGKDIYQRVFYRLSSYSEVDVYNNVIVEERVRFKPDTAKGEGYMKPVGPRTLILRNGKVEDGDIGDELLEINVKESMHEDATHGGAGTMEATIATILFIAANPKYIEGKVLEVGCKTGLAGLLGAIGAGAFEAGKESKKDEATAAAAEDDLFTIPKSTSLTKELGVLTLTDEDQESLNLALANAKLSRVPPSQLNVEEMKWRTRTMNRRAPKPFHTIIASDLGYNFLEAKELAHTVANRLEALSSWEAVKGDSKSPPTFVHLCPDAREDTAYLHKFLSQGYKMSVNTGYVKLEKIIFVYQMLPESEPEEKLDDLELEVQEFKEATYQSLMAVHDPQYADGAGEYFFPMETGDYDSAGGSTYLEPESDGSRWY